jgi:hypothetical protein
LAGVVGEGRLKKSSKGASTGGDGSEGPASQAVVLFTTAEKRSRRALAARAQRGSVLMASASVVGLALSGSRVAALSGLLSSFRQGGRHCRWRRAGWRLRGLRPTAEMLPDDDGKATTTTHAKPARRRKPREHERLPPGKTRTKLSRTTQRTPQTERTGNARRITSCQRRLKPPPRKGKH